MMEEIIIRMKYSLEGEDFEVKDPFHIEWIAQNKARLRESSALFSDFALFLGDEVTLQKADDVYDLIAITSPSQMLHFQTSAPPPPNTFTKALESIGGSWECDAGFIFTLHIPTKHKDAFATEHGINLDDWEEVFSGLQELDELNEDDILIKQAD